MSRQERGHQPPSWRSHSTSGSGFWHAVWSLGSRLFAVAATVYQLRYRPQRTDGVPHQCSGPSFEVPQARSELKLQDVESPPNSPSHLKHSSRFSFLRGLRGKAGGRKKRVQEGSAHAVWKITQSSQRPVDNRSSLPGEPTAERRSLGRAAGARVSSQPELPLLSGFR